MELTIFSWRVPTDVIYSAVPHYCYSVMAVHSQKGPQKAPEADEKGPSASATRPGLPQPLPAAPELPFGAKTGQNSPQTVSRRLISHGTPNPPPHYAASNTNATNMSPSNDPPPPFHDSLENSPHYRDSSYFTIRERPKDRLESDFSMLTVSEGAKTTLGAPGSPQGDANFGDEELVSNILPSYHMFQLTISKNLTPSDENYIVDPPLYEVTPVTSNTATPFSLLAVPLALQSPGPLSPGPEDFGFPFPDQEPVDIWENTILANAHKLPNLANSDNAVARDLELQIHVTEKVCQKGVQPVPADPLAREYQQGDYIHGYVTITNRSAKPVSFEMVYVVFEGAVVVLDGLSQPLTVYKFLNMLDLFASWLYANIDRLATDNGDPHDWCAGETDPYDGTALSIDVKRRFEPHVTYKRFFTFRVPDRLLDDACELHRLAAHTEVPPTVGMARSPGAPPPVYLLKAQAAQRIRDFAFMDLHIHYSVDARVVGRASEYGHPVAERDQYVVASERSCPIRIAPFVNMRENEAARRVAALQFFRAFTESVRIKIADGKEALAGFPALTPVPLIDVGAVSAGESAPPKLRQLYRVAGASTKHFSKQEDVYQCLAPYKKKLITGSVKIHGVMALSTPKESYRTEYVPPRKFREPRAYSTQLNIPVELSFFCEGGLAQPPDVRSLTCEIVVLTVRLTKHEIPVEIAHEMCFDDLVVLDGKASENNFDTLVVAPFQNYYGQIVLLVRKLGIQNERFRVETAFFRDLKCMAHLGTKYMNLAVADVKVVGKTDNAAGLHRNVSSIPWEPAPAADGRFMEYHKRLDVCLDLLTCHTKDTDASPGTCFDRFTLVPSFQTCHMTRLYYIRVSARLLNGTKLRVNVPLTVEK